MKRMSERAAAALTAALMLGSLFCGCGGEEASGEASSDVITLRVCSWEEYIDTGDWGEDEVIELDNGASIFGERSVVEEFEEWYYLTTGQRVKVEYSCFGTNEDLYNQLNIGDAFDLVCPSDYMIMKLMAEDELVEYSEEFFDTKNPRNYYSIGVSPYIRQTFEENEIQGESWSKYAACYMWGITGTIYNPETVSREDAATIHVYNNPGLARQITLKDNVRDTYFVILAMLNSDKLKSEAFRSSPLYREELTAMMNDVSRDTIDAAEGLLREVVGNLYSLETDSGKADMISGKVHVSYQWSGDAVYAMDQAQEDDFILKFAVPEECTNLWFDGWVMLKSGIGGDADKQAAAEGFVNFLSRPDIAVRNMNYIGYTSAISGGEDDTVFEFLRWRYEEDGTESYPLGYFFSGDDTDERYILSCSEEQLERQLFAQYPSGDVMDRAVIMGYYGEEDNKNINRMWINVRCFDISKVPAAVWAVLGGGIAGGCAWLAVRLRKR